MCEERETDNKKMNGDCAIQPQKRLRNLAQSPVKHWRTEPECVYQPRRTN